MKKLNFGCGSIQPDDWINVDKTPFGQKHIGSTELFENDQFDIIVAHCVLTCVQQPELDNLLKGLYRILKPAGVLRISITDIISAFEAYQNNNIDWFVNGEDSIDDRFSNWLTWYSSCPSPMTIPVLISRLTRARFNRVEVTNYKKSVFSNSAICELDTREGECIFVEAKK